MAFPLQDGETSLTNASKEGHADAVQALLDAGADRYAQVRRAPCLLMTAPEIMLSIGCCCSSLIVYGVVHTSVTTLYPADVASLVCAHGVHPGCDISCACTG